MLGRLGGRVPCSDHDSRCLEHYSSWTRLGPREPSTYMLTPDETSEKLQRQGQDAYRNKQFKSAMKLFSQALANSNISPTLQIRILDNRAATQEKLEGAENLQAALADAKKMIQLQKTSSHGYLRAGKILQLQGNDKAALDLYKYGLKRIAPGDDDGKKHLGGMYQKVLARLERPKATRCFDMMSILPLELVEMILQKLPFHSLMLAQGVSRTWRQFLTSSYQTYNTVDFSTAKRPVSTYALKTCVKRSKGKITRLVVSRSNLSDGQLLVYLAARCKDLSYVEVMGGTFTGFSVVEMGRVAENLKTLVLSCPTSMSAIMEVISQCERLESFECSSIIANAPAWWNPEKPMSLGRLLLASNSNPELASLRLPNLLQHLPKLRELELLGWAGYCPQFDFLAVGDLRVLTLVRIPSLREFPLLPPTIQRLDLSENPRLAFTLEHITASPLPNLESLNISSNPKIKNEIVLALLEPSLAHHRLRVLKMSMCPRLDFDSLDWFLDVGHGEMLEELKVAGNSTFGDQVSKELDALKALKRLDISHTMVSGIGVLNLVNRSGNAIEWLCLDGCEYVGYDAVQKVRGMGISVSHRSASDLRGGKRVRYRD